MLTLIHREVDGQEVIVLNWLLMELERLSQDSNIVIGLHGMHYKRELIRLPFVMFSVEDISIRPMFHYANVGNVDTLRNLNLLH